MKTISLETLKELKPHEGGLNPSEVDAQRDRFGANDILEVAGNPWLELFWDTAKDPMIWFLIGIGTVFFLTGEIADGITLFIAVLPLLFMDAFLHWRTQASTASLKSQMSSHVKVKREGKDVEIDSRELVPGDVLIVEAGILLPADGLFEVSQDIQIDESALTGESLPIKKNRIEVDLFTLPFHKEVKVPSHTLGFAGTRVLTGSGLLRVTLTGTQTSYGEIVHSVSRMPQERTPLQKSINRLVQILIFVAASLCLLLAFIRVYQGHGWLDALLSAAILAVAAIPEEFPVVFTFFLGVGIYRLAKKHALVRRAVSVENIGRITQICTDKTGTITVGRLTLTHLDAVNGNTDFLLSLAFGASSSDDDPIDIAIHEAAREKKMPQPVRLQTVPFTEDRKRETGFVQKPNDSIIACIKGAPETILAMSDLTTDKKEYWKRRVSDWAKTGHKVIGVAMKQQVVSQLKNEPDSGLEFCGLLAFEDPPRPEVAAAMSYCRQSGIRVLMITGDHPETAGAIAKDAGLTLETPTVVSAEDEPYKFQEEWLNGNPNYLKGIDVVARCTPMQKLIIVTALKLSGELVAVTGDGVNDVPALKAADIGIAMGERGTRSAKEVSSIILTDDNFSTIVNAIREGRQLFRNLTMSFEYLLLIHIPLVLTAAMIPLIGYPLVYLPVHIVWLELVIHPTALLAFQTMASLNHDEVNTQKFFFSKYQVLTICLTGTLLAFILGWSFLSRLPDQSSPEHARSMAMAILTLWSAGIASYLTRFRSQLANILSGLTVLSSTVFIQMSDRLEFLHLTPLHLEEWIISGLIVVFIISALDFLKRLPKMTATK